MRELLLVRRTLLFVSVFVASGCARIPALPTASKAPRVATCVLQALPSPIRFVSEDTRAAVHAFESHAGDPFAALYLKRAAGRPDQDICVCIVQQATDYFVRYTYHHGQLDSSRIRRASWVPLLARLDTGNYTAQCRSDATDPVFYLLLVKHKTRGLFSLCLETWQHEELSAADSARIAPAQAFIQRLTN
jgi:hypothetical protein